MSRRALRSTPAPVQLNIPENAAPTFVFTGDTDRLSPTVVPNRSEARKSLPLPGKAPSKNGRSLECGGARPNCQFEACESVACAEMIYRLIAVSFGTERIDIGHEEAWLNPPRT